MKPPKPFTFHKEYLIREFARHHCVGDPTILRLVAFQMGFRSNDEEYSGQLWMDNQSWARHSLEPSLDLAGRILDFEFTPRKFSESGPDSFCFYELSKIERVTKTTYLLPEISKSIRYEANLKSLGFEVGRRENIPRYELIIPLTADEYLELTELPKDAVLEFSMRLNER